MNILRCIVLAATALFVLRSALAGDLSPPVGPVSPTGKTLEQVRPGRVLNNLSGDALYMVVIDQPGVYFLTSDLVAAPGKNGIAVRVDGVTIDLSGFSLVGSTGITTGMEFGPDIIRGAIVRNGTIRGWAYGLGGDATHSSFVDLSFIDNNAGSLQLDAGESASNIFERVRVKGTAESGIEMGQGSIARDCIIEGTSGLTCGLASVIEGCTVKNASIFLYGGVVDRCTVTNGAVGTGIAIYDTGIVRNSVVRGGSIGIDAHSYFILESCSVFNATVGVRAVQNGTIRGCQISQCTTGISLFDIFGGRVVVDSNIIEACPTGISMSGPLSTAVRNTFINCATPITAASGNNNSPLVTDPSIAAPMDNLSRN